MISQHTINFIDSWLSFRVDQVNSPGMSVAISKDSELVLHKAYGLANLESAESMLPSHLFQIASHSKTFTATAIMSLQEQGLLRIDDSVVEYLPWLADHSDKRWREVTIRQLMSHSAGIVRDGTEADFWQLSIPFPDDETLVSEILKTDLAVEPNTQMKYSNLGYGLLGKIITAVTGDSYNSYILKNIIQPLKLKHTHVDIADIKPEEPRPVGYSRQLTKDVRLALPVASANALCPATGFWSTAEDLCVFYSSLMPGTGQLLSDPSKREMQRLQWGSRSECDAYGLGLQLESYSGRSTFGHMGGFPGFTTKTVVDQKSGLTVSVLMNSHDAEAGNVMENIFAIISKLDDYEPRPDELAFEGRFASLGGCIDVVSTPGGLIEIMPHAWLLFAYVENMRILDKDTLEYTSASAFSNRNERVVYKRKDTGVTEHIVLGGITMYPSENGDVRRFMGW